MNIFYLKNILKRSWLQIIFLIFVLGITVPVFLTLAFPDSRVYFKDGKREKIRNGEILQQTFTANRENLTGVLLPLKNTDVLTKDNTLTISLKDASCERRYVSQTLDRQSHWRAFRLDFDTILRSKNMQYCVELSFVRNNKEQKGTPWILRVPSFGSTEYYKNTHYDDPQSDAMLALRPIYTHTSIAENFTELTTRMSSYKPNAVKGTPIALLMFLTFFSTTVLILFLLRNRD